MESPNASIVHFWNMSKPCSLQQTCPKFLWTKTLQHAAWLKNRIATCTLGGRTPFEVVHKSKPNLESLPEWGTHVFMLQEGRGKLEEQADEGGWAMYSPDSQGHHVYWPSKHHVTVERNVNFGRVVQHDTIAEGWQDIPVAKTNPIPQLLHLICKHQHLHLSHTQTHYMVSKPHLLMPWDVDNSLVSPQHMCVTSIKE